MEQVGEIVELFGASTCPYTQELREHLRWQGTAFTEYDVDSDTAARARMLALTNGRRSVPVLLRNGRVSQIGWQGRSCTIDPSDRSV